MEEGADARAGGKDATHEATTHARPAAAAPVSEGSVAAILEAEAVRVRGERAAAESRALPVGGAAGVYFLTIFCSWAGRHSEESESRP